MAPAPEPAPIERWGQWIWTEQDAAIFEESRSVLPGLLPTVWIGTLRLEDGHIVTQLGQRPTMVQGERAVLVRLDDSVHAAWDTMPEGELARQLDERLARLMRLLRDHGIDPVEVQLDYDCPVRRLPQWAMALGYLAEHSLAGEPVWVTSLVAHAAEPAYGELLRGRIQGHLLQVFDTGDVPVRAREVGGLAVRAGLPYRMGLGAFERQRDGVQSTDHLAWFERLPETCVAPLCEGVWVFPAGRRWTDRIARPR